MVAGEFHLKVFGDGSLGGDGEDEVVAFGEVIAFGGEGERGIGVVLDFDGAFDGGIALAAYGEFNAGVVVNDAVGGEGDVEVDRRRAGRDGDLLRD